MSTTTASSQAITPAANNQNHELSIWAIMSFLFMAGAAYHYVIFGYGLRYSPADNNWLAASMMGAALIPLAFLERPSAIMLVNSIRLQDHIALRIIWLLVVVALAAMAFAVTMNSHETMAEQRDNRVSSHSSSLETLERQEKTAASLLEIAQQNAKSMAPSLAGPYLARANLQYNRSIERIGIARTRQYNNAPLAQSQEGAFEWLTAKVFSGMIAIAFSLGAIILTVFEQLHVRSNHRVPAFSLSPKLNQEWESFKHNFRAGNFDVDPSVGIMNGMFMRVKKSVVTPSTRIDDPRTINGEAAEKKTTTPPPVKPENDTKEAPAEGTKSNVNCPACWNIFSVNNAHLEPTKKNPHSLVKCGSCFNVFNGKASIVPDEMLDIRNNPNGKTYTECHKCRALYHLPNTLFNDREKNKIDCKHCNATIFIAENIVSDEDAKKLKDHEPDTTENSPAPSEFPTNSQRVHEDKQALRDTGNSLGTHQEFTGNSSGIQVTPIPDVNSPKNMVVDLTEIAKVDTREGKLKALADTIDQLSADPDSDGLFFPASDMKSILHMNYEPIKEVFQAKQAEGKVALVKRRYQIVYKAT